MVEMKEQTNGGTTVNSTGTPEAVDSSHSRGVLDTMKEQTNKKIESQPEGTTEDHVQEGTATENHVQEGTATENHADEGATNGNQAEAGGTTGEKNSNSGGEDFVDNSNDRNTPSEMSSEVSTDAKRSRSVNDFDTEYALRRALRDGKKRTSFVSWAVPDVMQLEGVAEEIGRLSNGDFSFDEDEGDDDDDFDSDLEDMLDNEYDPTLDWVISNLDKETSVEQSLDEELARLQVLRSYLILDSERESSFERLTALAGRMFDVPIALISLVDLGRQWFMSNRGLGDVRETPRKLAFCAHAILSTQDLLIVPDATKDQRFYDSPLVLGPPNIRFYAGAPLIAPEGVKLGTFCIIDSRTRPEGLTLHEKQNLRELAAMVIDAMVDRRHHKRHNIQDRSKQIACTAHDLLTPLSGVQMSVSLLQEDEALMKMLDDNQKELIDTAANCSDMMSRICHETIETFRGDVHESKQRSGAADRRVTSPNGGVGAATDARSGGNQEGDASNTLATSRQLKSGQTAINLASLVKNITMVMDPYPKKVPLYITIDPTLPKEFISNDLKVFRSIINYLTNACKHTERGCVHLKIFKVEKKQQHKGSTNNSSKKKSKSGKVSLMFEVEDTGKGIPLEQYSSLFRPFRDDEMGEKAGVTHAEDTCIAVDADGNFAPGGGGMCTPEMETPGLGLYSVATNIGSIGGEYGFRPREIKQDEENENLKSGSIFWFSIPLLEPAVSEQQQQQNSKKEQQAAESSASATANTNATNNDGTANHPSYNMAENDVEGKASDDHIAKRSQSFKSKVVQEGMKQYHASRRKIIICDVLPKDAMRSTKAATTADGGTTSTTKVMKNGRKARRLCAGSWNDEHIISNGDNVTATESVNVASDRKKSDPTSMSTSATLSSSGGASPSKGDGVPSTRSSASGGHFKVLSTNNMTETAAQNVFDMVSSVLEENKHKSDNDVSPPSPEPRPKAKIVDTKNGGGVNPPLTPIRKKCALVIDDSMVIRKSIGRALTTMGFDVTQATNGMEGLHALQSSVFDVVLCDFLMPVMDGLDCVQQYREWEESHRPTLKQFIIGISAHANPRDVERGIACGMSSFLSKPLPIKVLRELQGSKDLAEMSKKLDELNDTHDIPMQMIDSIMKTNNDQTGNNDNGDSSGGNNGKKPIEPGLVDEGDVRKKNPSGVLRRRVSQEEVKEEASGRSPICLIAEDSKTVAKVLIRAIEGRGWRTSWVENGEEALRLLKTRNWDAVFLDDEMPRMNGTQCLERFRAWEKDNRVATQKNIIFMSGNYIPPPPGAETSCAAFPKGFDGAVPKPVVLKDLYALLQKAAKMSDEKSSTDIMHR